MNVKFTIFETDRRVYDVAAEAGCSYVVGRSRKSDIQIRDVLISRKHCLLEVKDGKVYVKDLESANGITVDDKQVKFAELANRDVVCLGKSKISVAIAGERVLSPIIAPGAVSATGEKCHDCGRRLSPSDFDESRAYRTASCVFCKQCFIKRKDPVLGRVLSGCKVIERIGAGATGVIYKGEQTGMQRQVAIKVLKKDLLKDKKVVQKFMREARSLADLNHPNIMHVYNMGMEEGNHYIIMEYVPGKTVHDLIVERKKLKPVETAAIALQIAKALDYAFSKKIVHRDIKPANIIITPKGEAKLMDFGLAKNFEEAGKSGVTVTGEGLGTPNYMPPEQVENAVDADQRSDIYSLGASMYHMLSGRYPYEDASVYGLFNKILTQNPMRIREREPSVPEFMAAIVEKAMEKNPESRYQTPAEMMKDLAAALGRLSKKPTRIGG